MAQNLLSPEIRITETDATAGTTAVSSATGAFAGVFRWGPVNQRVLVNNETNLWKRFGKPSDFNAETFFSAANFLAYSNSLQVVRAANTSANLVSFVFPTDGNLAGITDNNMIVVSDRGQLTSNTSNVAFDFTNNSIFSAKSGDYILVKKLNPANTANVLFSNYRQILSVNSSTVVLDADLTFDSANTFDGIVTVEEFTGTLTAYANTDVVDVPAGQIVLNDSAYDNVTFDPDVKYVAKYPSGLGNSLKISVCDSANAYKSTLPITNCAFNVGSTVGTLNFANTNDANTSWNNLTIGDYLVVGNNSIGTQAVQVIDKGTAPVSGNTVTVVLANKYSLSKNFTQANTITRYWEFYNEVGTAPGQSSFMQASGNTSANDEVHVVVVDEDGGFTGVSGSVVEVWQNLSRATDAKLDNGTVNYYKTFINQNSNYIWFANDRSGALSAPAKQVASSTNEIPLTLSFNGGNDGFEEDTVDIAALATAWDLFQSKEDVDIDLVITGKARGGSYGEQLANYISDNIVTTRADCVQFASPDISDVVNQGNDKLDNVIQFFSAVDYNFYMVADSGYKYQYDKYNDTYRWIPLNGDLAGLCAATNNVWDSPGNGSIKNCIKLAWNPNKAERDVLYPAGINPVVSLPGQGPSLFGDKTHTTKASAFSRISIRRAFNYFEKSMIAPARAVLFKNNTPFTQNQFFNSIDPFYRNVKGLNGIEDYEIVCDSRTNTPEVINNFQFVGAIYIKPVYPINWVIINFVAVRNGVSFSEIVQ